MTEGCTVLVPSGFQDAAASSGMLHPTQNRCPTPQGPSQLSLPCLDLDPCQVSLSAGQVAYIPTLCPPRALTIRKCSQA